MVVHPHEDYPLWAIPAATCVLILLPHTVFVYVYCLVDWRIGRAGRRVLANRGIPRKAPHSIIRTVMRWLERLFMDIRKRIAEREAQRWADGRERHGEHPMVQAQHLPRGHQELRRRDKAPRRSPTHELPAQVEDEKLEMAQKHFQAKQLRKEREIYEDPHEAERMKDFHSRVTVTFKDVHYSITKLDVRSFRLKKFHILKGASGVIPSGRLTAIMGASGGGKTTLMNVISHRSHGGTITGDILFNGTPFGTDAVMSCGYCHQFDILFSHLTVREYLRYEALLKLPPSLTMEEKFDKVESVMLDLGIGHVADNVIGDEHDPGISGGQAKRVTIAAELMCDPCVLFLDEPTSGLDALSSLHLMKCLQKLADSGRSIVCTLHQPRQEIWNLLRHIILLKEGRVIFCGTPDESLLLLSTMSYKHPAMYKNKADYITDVICAPVHSKEGIIGEESILKRYEQSYFGEIVNASLLMIDAHKSFFEVPPRRLDTGNTMMSQAIVQTSRFISSLRNDPKSEVARLLQASIISVFLGSVFWQVNFDFQGTQDLLGSLYFVLTIVLVSPVLANNRFFEHFRVFKREYECQKVSSVAFLFGHWVLNTVLETLDGVIVSLFVFWMIGYGDRSDSGIAMIQWILYTILIATAVMSVSAMVVMLYTLTEESIARLFGMLFLNLSHLLSGFFIHVDNIPMYYIWIYWLSFTKWTMDGAVDLIVGPLTLHFVSDSKTCTEIDALANQPVNITACLLGDTATQPQCPNSGDDLLLAKGMSGANYFRSFAVLVGYWAIFRGLSIVIMSWYTLSSRRRTKKYRSYGDRVDMMHALDRRYGWNVYFWDMINGDTLDSEREQSEPKYDDQGSLQKKIGSLSKMMSMGKLASDQHILHLPKENATSQPSTEQMGKYRKRKESLGGVGNEVFQACLHNIYHRRRTGAQMKSKTRSRTGIFFFKYLLYSVPVWSKKVMTRLDDEYFEVTRDNYEFIDEIIMAVQNTPILRWKRLFAMMGLRRDAALNEVGATGRFLLQGGLHSAADLEVDDNDVDSFGAKISQQVNVLFERSALCNPVQSSTQTVRVACTDAGTQFESMVDTTKYSGNSSTTEQEEIGVKAATALNPEETSGKVLHPDEIGIGVTSPPSQLEKNTDNASEHPRVNLETGYLPNIRPQYRSLSPVSNVRFSTKQPRQQSLSPTSRGKPIMQTVVKPSKSPKVSSSSDHGSSRTFQETPGDSNRVGRTRRILTPGEKALLEHRRIQLEDRFVKESFVQSLEIELAGMDYGLPPSQSFSGQEGGRNRTAGMRRKPVAIEDGSVSLRGSSGRNGVPIAALKNPPKKGFSQSNKI